MQLSKTVLLLSGMLFFVSNLIAQVTLSGKITGAEKDAEIILVRFDNERYNHQDIATISLKTDGSFNYSAKLTIDIYMLIYHEKEIPVLITSEIQKTQIQWNVQQTDSKPVITGSEESTELNNFGNKYIVSRKKNTSEIDAEYDRISKNKEEGIITEEEFSVQLEKFNEKYNEQSELLQKELEQMLKDIKSPMVAYASMQYWLNEAENPLDLLTQICTRLSKSHPQSPFVEKMNAKKKRYEQTAVGAQAPELVLMSPEGKEIRLSSLKGQYVLIDFWASWCGPCREENPNVVANYQKYKDKGFTIYGISLDSKTDVWKKAIEKDGLTWTHVSDLKGWSSEAVYLYNVNGIPTNLLIDKMGKIIAKNLRGEDLGAMLNEIFGD